MGLGKTCQSFSNIRLLFFFHLIFRAACQKKKRKYEESTYPKGTNMSHNNAHTHTHTWTHSHFHTRYNSHFLKLGVISFPKYEDLNIFSSSRSFFVSTPSPLVFLREISPTAAGTRDTLSPFTSKKHSHPSPKYGSH